VLNHAVMPLLLAAYLPGTGTDSALEVDSKDPTFLALDLACPYSYPTTARPAYNTPQDSTANRFLSLS
jgi:hypothetical protein